MTTQRVTWLGRFVLHPVPWVNRGWLCVHAPDAYQGTTFGNSEPYPPAALLLLRTCLPTVEQWAS